VTGTSRGFFGVEGDLDGDGDGEGGADRVGKDVADGAGEAVRDGDGEGVGVGKADDAMLGLALSSLATAEEVGDAPAPGALGTGPDAGDSLAGETGSAVAAGLCVSVGDDDTRESGDSVRLGGSRTNSGPG
jgi:hypothetical protein